MTDHTLIETPKQLFDALEPLIAGDVGRAAFDTETSEVKDDRFTPWATDTRIGGFSVSYDGPEGPVDLYCPIRHRPYDWRRKQRLVAKKHQDMVDRLLQVEGVLPEAEGPGWAAGRDPNVDPAAAFELLADAFAVPGVSWGAHNWGFDAAMLLADGLTPPWELMFDTKVVNIFTDDRPLDRWDEEAERYFHTGHGLKQLGEFWLGLNPEEKDELDEARDILQCNDWCMLPLKTIVAPYGAKDTRLVLALYEHQEKRPAFQDEKVQELIAKHTREIRCAIDMERTGIGVDAEQSQVEAEAAATRQGEALLALNSVPGLNGVAIPITNPKELANTLYGTLDIPTYRGNRDTRKATLKQVRQRLMRSPDTYTSWGMKHEDAAVLIDRLMEWRKVEKELTSFYRPLTYFGEEGRIHTILRPLQAKTTRYSASKPNVQQMPKKGDVRKLFKPRDGHAFILCDFSTQELRVAAHYAMAIPEAFEWRFTWPCTLAKRGDCKGKPPHGPKDDLGACKKIIHTGWRSNWSRRPARMGLVEGFMSGDRAFDPHAAMVTTCASRGVEIDRGEGKTANFALLYGAFPRKLSETLDCTEATAKELHTTFWDHAYPELGRVRDFIAERLRRAGHRGPFSHQDFIRTLHGGRIHLDSSYHGLNYIVQRSCREILLNAILDTRAYIEERGIPYAQILPVHDELIFEAPMDSIDENVVRDLCRIMVEAGRASSVPMIVDPGIAEVSWGESSDLPVTWGYNGVTDGV